MRIRFLSRLVLLINPWTEFQFAFATSRSFSSTSTTRMATGESKWKDAKTIYEFSAVDIDGNNVSLEKYRYGFDGAPSMEIVNVSSSRTAVKLTDMPDWEKKDVEVTGHCCSEFRSHSIVYTMRFDYDKVSTQPLGKVCIIVNVACKCGLTNKNYTQLQDLYAKYAEKGLAILAFPSNDFAGQEPGSNEEIKQFVHDNFGVQFDLFSKIEVNGKNADPLFQFLKKEQKGTLGNFIKWNFSKFLVNREGKPVNRYSPNTDPSSFEKDIEKLL